MERIYSYSFLGINFLTLKNIDSINYLLLNSGEKFIFDPHSNFTSIDKYFSYTGELKYFFKYGTLSVCKESIYVYWFFNLLDLTQNDGNIHYVTELHQIVLKLFKIELNNIIIFEDNSEVSSFFLIKNSLGIELELKDLFDKFGEPSNIENLNLMSYNPDTSYFLIPN